MPRFNDASGKLEIEIVERQATKPQSSFKDFAVEVSRDMVCVGGGAVGDLSGGYLTASYPREDLKAWLVSSKDHIHPAPHRLRGYAIGMRLTRPFLEPNKVRDFIHVYSNSSEILPHPEVRVSVNPEEFCIGGGFQVHWEPGEGNIATGSMADVKDGLDAWIAQSKDHLLPSPASLQVYAIGIDKVLDSCRLGGEPISLNWTFDLASSPVDPHPHTEAWLKPGYVLTGGGAQTIYRRAGNLLWKLAPIIGPDKALGFEGGGKDLDKPDPCVISVRAIGIKAM